MRAAPAQRLYNSKQFADAAGLSLRQVQWLDDNGIISSLRTPYHSRNRVYTDREVRLALVYARFPRMQRRTMPRLPGRVLSRRWLLFSRRASETNYGAWGAPRLICASDDRAAIIRAAAKTRGAVVLVELPAGG